MHAIKICTIHNIEKKYKERVVKGNIRKENICLLCVKQINAGRKGKYKDSAKKYRDANKKQIAKNRNSRRKLRRQTDISFRLREDMSSMVRNAIKGNKNNYSFLDYVKWSIKELKEHLEKQFEPWMGWNNWGVYRANRWNNNDQTTWKWQIDHKIPQSILTYKSMEDENFKLCWSLDNLRPLSAKQNAIDGATKTRHK